MIRDYDKIFDDHLLIVNGVSRIGTSLVENLTALSFLLSFIVGVALAVMNKRKRVALTAVSAIGLLGFLDELAPHPAVYLLRCGYVLDGRLVLHRNW